MAFDKSLDKELFSETASFETAKITVGVFSYNDGEPKIQISRQILDNTTGEWKFAKLGRMLREEAEAVIPMLQKALEFMPQQKQEASEGDEAQEDK
ncbi:MAG: hypothetical protein R6U32_01500 [Candidatus Woesearchaeota archaeon]